LCYDDSDPDIDFDLEAAMENSLAQRNILVVDDDENVALSLQYGLATLPNCRIAVATNGDQALQISRRQSFDLLITDYNMPGMDGITLARQVRQLYPQTAIIMITAYNSDVLRGQAESADIRCILDKPAGLVEIRSAASQALRNGTGSSLEKSRRNKNDER
jgi:CheY-like chemotaxis protein